MKRTRASVAEPRPSWVIEKERCAMILARKDKLTKSELEVLDRLNHQLRDYYLPKGK